MVLGLVSPAQSILQGGANQGQTRGAGHRGERGAGEGGEGGKGGGGGGKEGEHTTRHDEWQEVTGVSSLHKQ